MNHFRSKNDSLKYLRLTSSVCKDIAIVKSGICGKCSIPLLFKSDLVKKNLTNERRPNDLHWIGSNITSEAKV